IQPILRFHRYRTCLPYTTKSSVGLTVLRLRVPTHRHQLKRTYPTQRTRLRKARSRSRGRRPFARNTPGARWLLASELSLAPQPPPVALDHSNESVRLLR